MYQECWSTETELLNDPENKIQKTKIMASGPITSWEIDGSDFIFWGSKFTDGQMVIAAMKLKEAYSLEGKL